MRNNKHILLFILVIFGLVLVSGCINKQPEPGVNNTIQTPIVDDIKPTPPPPPPKPVPENYVSTSTANILSWITFRHEGMGIEISAPKEFYAESQSVDWLQLNNRPEKIRDNDMWYDDQLKISLSKSKDKYAGKTYGEIDFCEEKDESTVFECEEIEINGHIFVRDYSKDMMGFDHVGIRTIYNGSYFNAGGIDLTHPTNSNYTKKEVKDLYIKIFLTVKFTK